MEKEITIDILFTIITIILLFIFLAINTFTVSYGVISDTRNNPDSNVGWFLME